MGPPKPEAALVPAPVVGLVAWTPLRATSQNVPGAAQPQEGALSQSLVAMFCQAMAARQTQRLSSCT
eukprot:6156284-Pyramimonas_sp.AAC.1